jgi:hypothetical protein
MLYFTKETQFTISLVPKLSMYFPALWESKQVVSRGIVVNDNDRRKTSILWQKSFFLLISIFTHQYF